MIVQESTPVQHKPEDYPRGYYEGQRGKGSIPDWLRPLIDKISEKSELRSAEHRAVLIAGMFTKYKLNESEDEVLDVGAGRYHLDKALDKKSIESTGLDLSREGFELSKEKGEEQDEMKVVQASGLFLPFEKDQFSTIHCSDVLEHLVDKHEAERFLNELGRVGEKMLIIQLTPTDYMFGWAIDHDQTHRLKMSTKEWNKIIKNWGEENGWSIKERFWQKLINKVVPDQPPAWILVKDQVTG